MLDLIENVKKSTPPSSPSLPGDVTVKNHPRPRVSCLNQHQQRAESQYSYFFFLGLFCVLL